MLRSRRFLLLALMLMAAILVVVAWRENDKLFSPLGTVTIRNASGKPAVVKLKHKRGTIVVGTLNPGQERSVRFDVGRGESGYVLYATVGNRTMTGGGYVESGYRVSEAITATVIKSVYEFP